MSLIIRPIDEQRWQDELNYYRWGELEVGVVVRFTIPRLEFQLGCRFYGSPDVAFLRQQGDVNMACLTAYDRIKRRLRPVDLHVNIGVAAADFALGGMMIASSVKLGEQAADRYSQGLGRPPG